VGRRSVGRWLQSDPHLPRSREENLVPPRIGDLLVQRGVVTPVQIDAILRDGRGRGLPLASRLLAAGVDEGALAAALAERYGVPGVDLSRTAIPLHALDVVPRAVAESDLILPVSLDGGRLHLAMARPLDTRVLSEVRFVTGLEISAYVALRAPLERAIEAAYDARARGAVVHRGRAAGQAPYLAARLPGLGSGDEPLDVVEMTDLQPLVGDDDDVAIEVGTPEPLPIRIDGRPLVLVVDDEPEIRQLVQRTLEAKGYRVETAADGEEAIARAEALAPDLVLLDAMLPKVHGFEACRRLKSSARTRGIPVVMMTAVYRGWRFAQDARENYGAEDYIEKPFRLDDLLRRVEEARATTASRPVAPSGAVEATLARGRQHLAAGRLVDAAAAFSEATRVDPYSAEAHLHLGRALRAQGDGFGAMTALERAAELRPASLGTLRALAALYEEKGFRRKAAETLERALPGAPDEETRGALRGELLRLLA
jgi:CheY-like chemotaxis protein